MNTTEIPAVNRIKQNGHQQLIDTVEIPKLEFRTVTIPINGKTPLIVHNWSAKAVRMMLDKQTGKASKGREKKDPFEDFKSSLYSLPDGAGYGLPAPAFKACAVSAANSVELKMTQMKQAFHVNHYTVPIIAKPIKSPVTPEDNEYSDKLKPYHKLGISMRMDVVRLETGVADLRFRAWFPEWSVNLEVEYNPRMITLEQLMNLFESGGNGVGVGEWRPGAPNCRSGEYGRFTLLNR
jgi:hypothetical protein